MTSKKQQRQPDPEPTPEIEPGADVSEDELARLAEEARESAEIGDSARQIGKMAAALEQKTKEAAEASEKYLRTYADFENYRKRVQRDQADFKKYANEQMALELLTVLDHLGLALKHASEPAGGGEGLLQGVEMVARQFRDVLEKFGIKAFKAEGEPFDPALHDAMMQVETGEVPENTVVQVLQDGYRYHEKILRHAKVGVSKRVPPQAGGADTGDGDGEED